MIATPSYPAEPVEFVEIETLEAGDEVAKVEPMRVPAKHRHLKAADAVSQPLIEQVLISVKADTADELRAKIIQRLGYSPRRFDQISRRVARWNTNRAEAGHRLPNHIRLMAVAVEIVEQAVAEFSKPKAPEPGFVDKVVGGAKKLAKDFVSEVKAQQA